MSHPFSREDPLRYVSARPSPTIGEVLHRLGYTLDDSGTRRALLRLEHLEKVYPMAVAERVALRARVERVARNADLVKSAMDEVLLSGALLGDEL